MLWPWVAAKLEIIKDRSPVLIQDPLQLLADSSGEINAFARENGFTVIIAQTNLAFRELYERAVADTETKKLLVLDRAPLRRRAGQQSMKAPPPFYPDLVARLSDDTRTVIDLCQFLIYKTGDPNWPVEANDPRYARLIMRYLPGVLEAHGNLRAAAPNRFTDDDFKKIVAFPALGIARSAFKKLDAEDYWRIGLLGHQAFEKLETLAPEITLPIKEALRKAPAPFCFFADKNPEEVIRSFYLSVILAQHTESWQLLLDNIDPALKPLAHIDPKVLSEAAPRLVALDREQARQDLKSVECSLSCENVQLVLIDQLKVNTPAGFAAAIEKERYSSLFKSLSLLLALDNLISPGPAKAEQDRVAGALLPAGGGTAACLVDTAGSVAWTHLKEAYKLVLTIAKLRQELATFVKTLKVAQVHQLSFASFYELWNAKKINRLEYYLSTLERHIQSGEFLPGKEDGLPSLFSNALQRIREQVSSISENIRKQLQEVNRRFQDLVAARYPSWVAGDGEVYLTSQFLRRCLKPNWDPQKEKAAMFIFDGMRYDIWDELLRPVFEERMDIVADLPALSLLPSETHITRNAIAAGTFPDAFDFNAREDKLLKDGLLREVGYSANVQVIPPEGAGTGEVVRYQAGNFDVYIFEFCDKELHDIKMKSLPGGRQVPSRPLSFVYQQHLKSIIDTEVMAIVRRLAPGTKVFVTADHGFGPAGRDALWFRDEDLNEREDCRYTNCLLRVPLPHADIPDKVRDNVLAFQPKQLRLPETEVKSGPKGGAPYQKQFKAIVFPRTGYCFSRKGSPFNPDAYTHGGISLQELMIPMVVLRVKAAEQGLLRLEATTRQVEAVEGQEAEFRIRLTRLDKAKPQTDEVRVEVEAGYNLGAEHLSLPGRTAFVASGACDLSFSFRPDTSQATADERKQGNIGGTVVIAAAYQEGNRPTRKSITIPLTVRLNSERVIRRVPPQLGNILGLTPKSMK